MKKFFGLGKVVSLISSAIKYSGYVIALVNILEYALKELKGVDKKEKAA